MRSANGLFEDQGAWIKCLITREALVDVEIIVHTGRRLTCETRSSITAEIKNGKHCSFYGDKTSKAVKGFFLNQLYRSWGHTAHRGWARLLLDRRSLVRVPNAPRRRARADDRHYEENIMESYFHPEVNHHVGSGPYLEPCLDTTD